MSLQNPGHLELDFASQFITSPSTSNRYFEEKMTPSTSSNLCSPQRSQPSQRTSSTTQLKNNISQVQTKAPSIIHSLDCIKKLRNNFLKPKKITRNKNNNNRKQNNFRNSQITYKVQESQDRRVKKKGQTLKIPLDMLELRALQLNQELKQFKTKKGSIVSRPQSMGESELNEYISFDTSKFKPKPINQEGNQSEASVFLKLQSEIEKGEENKFRNTNKKGQCFYDKLKQRLSVEIQKIKLKKETQQPLLMIEGCSMKSRPGQDLSLAFKNSLTQRKRPRTTLGRTGVETSRDGMNRYRPMSSKSRVLQKRQIEYKSKQIDERQAKQLAANFGDQPVKKKVKKICSTKIIDLSSSNNLKHITPVYKKRNWSARKSDVDRQKMKQKMLELLIECHDASQKNAPLNKGINVFEQYCKQVDKNFQKTSRFIEHIQRQQFFFADEQQML